MRVVVHAGCGPCAAEYQAMGRVPSLRCTGRVSPRDGSAFEALSLPYCFLRYPASDRDGTAHFQSKQGLRMASYHPSDGHLQPLRRVVEAPQAGAADPLGGRGQPRTHPTATPQTGRICASRKFFCHIGMRMDYHNKQGTHAGSSPLCELKVNTVRNNRPMPSPWPSTIQESPTIRERSMTR